MSKITFRPIPARRIQRSKGAVARILSSYEAFDGDRKIGRVYSVEDSSRSGCIWVAQRGFDTSFSGSTRGGVANALAVWVAEHTVAAN